MALDGYVHGSSILDGDFIKTGDSGVVSVGKLPESAPHDGTGVASLPTNNTIARCHFGSTGVYGKQTSALFVAVSKQIRFTDNVLYDGPRVSKGTQHHADTEVNPLVRTLEGCSVVLDIDGRQSTASASS